MKRSLSHLCLAAACVAFSPAMGSAQGPETHLVWTRGAGDTIHVTATARGPRLEEASQALQRTADRLEAIRTIVSHVRWQEMRWIDGRLEVDAHAESSLYANVTLLAVRDLWPGRASAGSGMRQLRSVKGRMGWLALIRLAPPR